jgi:hypothetical protein
MHFPAMDLQKKNFLFSFFFQMGKGSYMKKKIQKKSEDESPSKLKNKS